MRFTSWTCINKTKKGYQNLLALSNFVPTRYEHMRRYFSNGRLSPHPPSPFYPHSLLYHKKNFSTHPNAPLICEVANRLMCIPRKPPCPSSVGEPRAPFQWYVRAVPQASNRFSQFNTIMAFTRLPRISICTPSYRVAWMLMFQVPRWSTRLLAAWVAIACSNWTRALLP